MSNHTELEPCQHTCPDCGKVWSHIAEGAKPIHCIVKDVNHVRCVECQSKFEIVKSKQYYDMLHLPPQTLLSNPWFNKERLEIRVKKMTYQQNEEHLAALAATMTMLKADQAAHFAYRGELMQDMSDSERRALCDEHEKRKQARKAVKESKIEAKGQTAGQKAIASLVKKGVDMSKLNEMLASIRAKAVQAKETT